MEPDKPSVPVSATTYRAKIIAKLHFLDENDEFLAGIDALITTHIDERMRDAHLALPVIRPPISHPRSFHNHVAVLCFLCLVPVLVPLSSLPLAL